MNVQLLFFIGIVQGILFATHYIVYKSIMYFGDFTSDCARNIKLSLFVLSIFFFIGSIITSYGYTPIGRIVYAFSATWLGVLFWLFIGALVSIVLWNVLSHIFPVLTSPDATYSIASHVLSYKQLFGSIVLICIVGINIYGLSHAFQINVKEYTVALPHLPESWEQKKIVLIADTHFGNIWNTGTAKKIAQQIQALSPEAVLIAGDFFDGPTIDYSAVTAPFGQIQTTYGTFYVTGNHEEYRDVIQYTDAIASQGITVLHNEFQNIHGLIIAGIAYGDSTTEATQDETLARMFGRNQEDRTSESPTGNTSDSNTSIDTHLLESPIILIKHVPHFLKSAQRAGVDLQVSGHTHNGQMWPASLIARAVYKGYHYGLNTFTDQQHILEPLQVLTTSGAGSWGPPQRIGTQNEIVLITLTNKK